MERLPQHVQSLQSSHITAKFVEDTLKLIFAEFPMKAVEIDTLLNGDPNSFANVRKTSPSLNIPEKLASQQDKTINGLLIEQFFKDTKIPIAVYAGPVPNNADVDEIESKLFPIFSQAEDDFLFAARCVQLTMPTEEGDGGGADAQEEVYEVTVGFFF